MKRLNFPEIHLHAHTSLRNVNELFDEQRTSGQRAADWVVRTILEQLAAQNDALVEIHRQLALLTNAK